MSGSVNVAQEMPVQTRSPYSSSQRFTCRSTTVRASHLSAVQPDHRWRDRLLLSLLVAGSISSSTRRHRGQYS